MLNIEYNKDFLKTISKIKDHSFIRAESNNRIRTAVNSAGYRQERFTNINFLAYKSKFVIQIEKILENPELGKPMRFNRKGTRELYVSPYRIAYAYVKSENKLIFLDIYHKDEQ